MRVKMPTIVHFDIPADDPARAKNFYGKLFGWKFENPFETVEYYLFNTEDLEGKNGVGGGLGKREKADDKITTYIGVTSIDEYLLKIEELGGKVLAPKMPVPGWGYLAVCMDTENNIFGLWEDNTEVK